jgi:uncharacterized protein
MEERIIQNTIVFVKEQLAGAETGHNWSHIERVWKMAQHIQKQEGTGDPLVVELAALLHDISDPKFNGGDEEKGSRMAADFLAEHGLDSRRITHIGDIIQHVSFKGGVKKAEISTIEFRIVQDADRLDAMGAIGIARAFNYGGFKNRPIYDPYISPRTYSSTREYRQSDAPTITHFYEKLLKLKDLMNTSTGKSIARERHAFMLGFLETFYREIDPGNTPSSDSLAD